MSVCLDAFALLAWLQAEPGADQVEGLLRRAAGEAGFRCFVSAISLGEVYYRLCRLRGVDEADGFWEDARRGTLPVVIIEPGARRILQAARLKAGYAIAFADAFAVQLAQEMQAALVTGDPEIEALAGAGVVEVVWLPRVRQNA